MARLGARWSYRISTTPQFIRATSLRRRPLLSRPFSQRTHLGSFPRSSQRPQIQFQAGQGPWQVSRLISFITKHTLKENGKLALKLLIPMYGIIFTAGVITTGFYLQYIEYQHPTPREWTSYSRYKMRSAFAEMNEWTKDNDFSNWERTATAFAELLRRLEDPKLDGSKLKDQVEGGILVKGLGKMGYDINEYGYEWRQGYFQCLMAFAKASEHVAEEVTIEMPPILLEVDPLIRTGTPGANVTASVDSDVVLAPDKASDLPSPDTVYMKILTTTGFTQMQRLEAAVRYAEWLQAQALPESAEEMYRWGLDVAAEELPDGVLVRDGIIDVKHAPPTASLLSASTSFGIYLAQHGQLSRSLPILVSVLRASRTLSPGDDMITPPNSRPEDGWVATREVIKSIFKELPYPPLAPTGNEVPSRTAAIKCQESKLMAHIGEILFVSSHHEDGVTWTRDAIDIAEENYEAGGAVCRGCLQMSMDNWKIMVREMAKAEAHEPVSSTKSWWSGKDETQSSRWSSEEKEIMKRQTRLQHILGLELTMPQSI